MQAVIHPDGRLILGREEYNAVLGRAGVRVHKQEATRPRPSAC